MRRITLTLALLVMVGVMFSSCKKEETSTEVSTKTEGRREILYWTCGMHPSVRVLPEEYEKGQTKCPICNMNLVAVYKEKTVPQGGGAVSLTLSPRARRLASVSTIEVTYLPLYHEIRAMGRIEWDERKLAHISSWVPGRIDKLFVDFTGKQVKKGDPLVWIYSPNLVTAQQEYLLALETLGKVKESHIEEAVSAAKSLITSAKRRLLLWGITQEQVRELEKRRVPKTHLTIYSPLSGTVIKKTALEGKYVKEGEAIYCIANPESLWMFADIYEDELSWVRDGQEVEITSVAYPSEVFKGRISFINPYLDERTRSVKIRVDISNSGERLKPGMYVDALIRSPIGGGKGIYYTCPMHPEVVAKNPGECSKCGMHLQKVEGGLALAVPKSAILDLGGRKLVYVEKGEGRYEAREVKVGPEGKAVVDGIKQRFLPVVEGLAAGERVVTRGNFLIDSQTQLSGKAAGAYGGALKVEEGE